ncbi:MAG: PD40 domain-containing protein [Planctomycetes bacterium]|nr:PD40 domain-containing protein [Planctomycetota bacterium]
MRAFVVFALLLVLAAVTSAQWSPAVVVPELSSSGSDYYPFISRDNLTFRIASGRTDIPGSPGGWDIYQATRTNPHSSFGPISREPGINGSTNDLGQHIMWDELTAYAANSQTPSVGGHDIWMFTRPSPASPWAAGTNLTQLNSSGTDYCVTVTDDHLEMYFSRNGVLVQSTRAAITTTWSAPVTVAELNTPTLPANCYMPCITGDGLTMYVANSMTGGLGGYDLYVVTRKRRGDPWGTPVHLANVNSSSSDHRPSLSPDGRQLFFSSTQPAPSPLASNNVWVSYFSGLSYQNLPQIASPLLLHVTESTRRGMGYQVALSLSNNRGIPVPNVGMIPLDLDALFLLSVQNVLPQVFANFAGALDIHGEATATIIIPPSLGLVGIEFYAAAITYDVRINYITNGLVFSIHR